MKGDTSRRKKKNKAAAKDYCTSLKLHRVLLLAFKELKQPQISALRQ